MSKGALIIGGSLAGIQAALDLANSGIQVHLVEPSPFLGNGGVATVPGHLLNARLLEVAKHPNVATWTNTSINRVDGEAGRFHVELRQHPRYVDLSRCTACGDCVDVCPVNVPGTGRKAIYLDGCGQGDGYGRVSLAGPPPPWERHSAGQANPPLQPGCAAIDKLGKPPCSNTCPGGIHVQGYVALIAEGRFQEAIDLIREAIPFPGICGRICTHPCEVNCRRAEVDAPVSIRLLKRFVSDWELEARRSERGPGAQPERRDEEDARGDAERRPPGEAPQVAIVGAGPGGMTVADRLARLGYGVTVFEKLPVIGGMMAVGIPEYRLPRDVIAREYQRIQDLGVEIRLSTPIGPKGAHTLDDLFAMGYKAVCLAVGAHKSRELRIPGEDLPGVVHGIDLLKAISLRPGAWSGAEGLGFQAVSQVGGDRGTGAGLEGYVRRGAETRVAVLGGGNTAMDVSRSLRRLGVEDVRILYRRTRSEMPALPEEIEDAEREGVTFEYLVSPIRVLGNEETGVVGLECLRMKLGEPDASGRRRPVPIAGSEFVVDLDLVVLAVGQAPDLECLGHRPGLLGAVQAQGSGTSHDHGIAITRDDRINVDGISFMTSRPGVFAVGDAVTSDKMAVIEAIGMGKKAASEIQAYLQGEQPHEIVVDAREAPIARREMTADELITKPRLPVPALSLEQRLAGYDEVELGFSAEQAVAEAQRCLVCGPCSECLACERACKPGAVVHEQQEIFADLEIGAIIYAGAPESLEHLPLDETQGLYCVSPENPLLGSAAAARAMFDLFSERQLWRAVPGLPAPGGAPRIGVFVCQCGDSIARVVDTEAVCDRAALWPAVTHSQVLSFACSAEAAETVCEAVEARDLNRVVVAACSCCAIDQVCYSCTFQRVRCKDNLGVFANAGSQASNVRAPIEFVNIREQCAWAHAGDPGAATAKATALVAGAVARARTLAPRPVVARTLERSALILGSGDAAHPCLHALERQGITAQQVGAEAVQIRRAEGWHVVTADNSRWQASALVLAARDDGEAQRLLVAFGENGRQPRAQPAWGALDTQQPGVFHCEPGSDPATAGAAAAARVAAWLGQADRRAEPITATVDPARCRACNTCVEICEFGAARLVEAGSQRTSWIDPAICTGCGACAAHCPSGAITAGYSTDAQLEAMLDAVLA